jgi:hypothetical protein
MSQHRSEFEEAGAILVAIGNGSALMARDFQERFEVKIPVYTDPSRRSYELAGLKRSALFFGPRTMKRGRRAKAAGFRQGKVAGDPWQQGGDIIISPAGEMLYARVSDGPGDHAPIDELIATLRGYVEESSR